MTEKQAESPKVLDETKRSSPSEPSKKQVHASSIPIIGGGSQLTGSSGQGGPSSIYYDKGRMNMATFEAMVMVPAEMCGVVIGKGGWNIRRIRETANIRVYFEQDGDQETTSRRKKLHLQGSIDGVRLAMGMVNQCLRYCRNTLTRRSPNVSNAQIPVDATGAWRGAARMNDRDKLPVSIGQGVEVEVPGFAVGYIIGKQGDNIRKLTEATGTRIQFNRTDSMLQSQMHRAYIEGNAEQTEKCIAMMNDMVKKLYLIQQQRASETMTQAGYPYHQFQPTFSTIGGSNTQMPGQQGYYGTGAQPDFTKEWIDYYVAVGNYDEANLLRERLKQQ